jgi:hypothetical protein
MFKRGFTLKLTFQSEYTKFRQLSNNMAVKGREHLCGDTLNLFGREGQRFQWSRYYWYYSLLPLLEENENIVSTSGIASAGCVPEVFDYREILSWCVDKHERNRRVIQIQGESLVSLSPSIFRSMLKLPEPTITFKGEEVRQFLKETNSGLELLREHFEDTTTMLKDLSNIQVSSFKNPYKEIAWLFIRVTYQESTTTIPRYILYFTVHEKAIFDWAKIISIQISSQLENFKENKRFYMYSYLIFSITYCHVFKGLSIEKRVDCKIDPIPMWYQALWRHRVTYHFYEVYNRFVSIFKKLIFGSKTSRLSLEASKFLDKRGSYEKMEHYNVIIIYCSHEKPLYLPYFVSDRMFVTEVAKQYRFWVHFFHEKKEKAVYSNAMENWANFIKRHF